MARTCQRSQTYNTLSYRGLAHVEEGGQRTKYLDNTKGSIDATERGSYGQIRIGIIVQMWALVLFLFIVANVFIMVSLLCLHFGLHFESVCQLVYTSGVYVYFMFSDWCISSYGALSCTVYGYMGCYCFKDTVILFHCLINFLWQSVCRTVKQRWRQGLKDSARFVC